MEARKLAIISGLYANTNLDGKDSPRQKMIADMEENFREAIANLYDPQPEVELPKDNPFFGAINVPGGDIDWAEYADNNKTDPANFEEDLEIDQN